jgi:hypothetical protein
MDTKTTPITQQPPRIFQAFIKGFNAVANHAYLLLFPLLLDLFLWLGPNFTASKTAQTFISLMEEFFQEIQNNSELLAQYQSFSPELLTSIESFEKSKPDLIAFFSNFDLFGFLNTQPIGIPSMISFLQIVETPFGAVKTIQAGSAVQEFFVFILILLFGCILGAIYLYELGRNCNVEKEKQTFSITGLLTTIGWMISINFAIWLSLFIMFLPGVSIISWLLSINSRLALMAFFILLLFLFWMIIPLFFTPHGIIIQKQNPFMAMLASVRLIRYYLPGTGLFLLLSLFLYQGFNQFLWLKPEITSFMLIGGIFGHAFVCTGLLAASFMYYQDGLRWMNHNLKMIAQQPNQSNRPFQV